MNAPYSLASSTRAPLRLTLGQTFIKRMVAVSPDHPISTGTSQNQNIRFLSFWSTSQQQQHVELLRQPIPTLIATTEKFLKFARPIQSDEEFSETVKVVKEFHINPQGRILQNFLDDRFCQLENWLTPWWLDCAYLEARTPLPIWTSPGVTFLSDNKSQKEQLVYSAQIIHGLLKFHHMILNNELTEDKVTVRISVPKDVNYKKLIHAMNEPREEVMATVPLDMSQYKNLFGTVRIPKLGKDEIKYGRDQLTWAQHIIVVRNGNSFHCPVYDENGKILGIAEIRSQLEKIMKNSNDVNLKPINLVSSDERNNWANVYTRLKETNPSEIEDYESALFVFALDGVYDSIPGYTTEDQNMGMAIHGGGPKKNAINRWYDKTLQFYVNGNGNAGMTYEHTPAEGPPLARLLDYISQQIKENNFDSKNNGSYQDPLKLSFKLDDQDIDAIGIASSNLERMVQNLEVKMSTFQHFGKNVPKAARLSPDSLIQVALQVTFFRMHNKLPPAYETATLRRFVDGRTENIRFPTVESAAFVKAFNNSSNKLEKTALRELLDKAIASHKDYTNKAMSGKGMDRHLLGLRLIAKEKGLPIPKILESDAYQRLMHFQLSTSQVPTKFPLPMGFGPSHHDCYGVCYNPQEERIYFTITAFNDCNETSAVRFATELERALMDLRDLIESTDTKRRSNI